ncbi:hypothetical protein [Bacillus sp. T33-2]|uniref:hypothetical protein n=1 Tax=Bacillus sp. T33-2 TaxID=2054168 RepID=UPI000C75DEB3|nr:hypothetical protein [Bacillus sp. T33-2]PLR99484.1 hypothetical protein CVD19_00035 [Bacillus sp. T33-2]
MKKEGNPFTRMRDRIQKSMKKNNVTYEQILELIEEDNKGFNLEERAAHLKKALKNAETIKNK